MASQKWKTRLLALVIFFFFFSFSFLVFLFFFFFFTVAHCFVCSWHAKDFLEACSAIGVTSLLCCRVCCKNVRFREKKEINYFLAVCTPFSNIFYPTSNSISQRRQETRWKISGNNVTNCNTVWHMYYVHIIRI